MSGGTSTLNDVLDRQGWDAPLPYFTQQNTSKDAESNKNVTQTQHFLEACLERISGGRSFRILN